MKRVVVLALLSSIPVLLSLSLTVEPDGTVGTSDSRQRTPSPATMRLQLAAKKAKSSSNALRTDILDRLVTALSAERLIPEVIEARRELLGVMRADGGVPIAAGILKHSVALAADLKSDQRFVEALAVVRDAQAERSSPHVADPAAIVLLLKVNLQGVCKDVCTRTRLVFKYVFV